MKKIITQIPFFLVYSGLIAVFIFWIFPEKIGSVHLPDPVKEIMVATTIIIFLALFFIKNEIKATMFWIKITNSLLLFVFSSIAVFAWINNINFQDWLKLSIFFTCIILFINGILYLLDLATKKVFFQTSPKENLIEKINGCIYKIFYAHIETYNLRAEKKDQICYDTFGQWYADEILSLEVNTAEREKLIDLIMEKINAVFFNIPMIEKTRYAILKNHFLSSPPLSRVTQVSNDVFIFYLDTFLEYVLEKYNAENFNRKTIRFVFKTIKKWGVPFNKSDVRTILLSNNTGQKMARGIYTSIKKSARD